MIRLVGQILLMILPWALRRRALNRLFGYQIAPSAKIGLSIVAPEDLVMDDGSYIGHLNVIVKLQLLKVGKSSSIGALNYITAMPRSNSQFFREDLERKPALLMGDYSAITKVHYIDCTDTVILGEFSTFAGLGSQILTHAVEFSAPRQRAQPVSIGRYCFVGTKSVFLPGAQLPDYSILAAGSVLHKPMVDCYRLYGGTPARELKELDRQLGYFLRTSGFIN